MERCGVRVFREGGREEAVGWLFWCRMPRKKAKSSASAKATTASPAEEEKPASLEGMESPKVTGDSHVPP